MGSFVWPERVNPAKRDSTRWGWGIYEGPKWIKVAGGWVPTRAEAFAMTEERDQT